MTESLGTILTAMVTPFDADLAVDHGSLAALAEYLLANGSDGLVVAGTTGESPTLTDDEKLAMFRTVVAAVGDRVPVVAGTGSNDTASQRRAHARGRGVRRRRRPRRGPPYYNKPPERGVLAHFRAVAAATSLPVIVYNIPGRCVVNLSPEALADAGRDREHRRRQAGQPGPRRDRPAHGAQRPRRLRRQRRHAARRACARAALGGICVASHVVGPRHGRDRPALPRGRPRRGRGAEDAALHDLYKALFVTANPIPVKAALNLLGHEVGGLRLPLVPATPEEEAVVAAELRRLGLHRRLSLRGRRAPPSHREGIHHE